jgi:hypothetical protein
LGIENGKVSPNKLDERGHDGEFLIDCAEGKGEGRKGKI